MTKMNNPLHVAVLVKKLQKIPRRKNQAVREREQLEQEREQIMERLPLRERLKDLFKKTASPLQPLLLLLA